MGAYLLVIPFGCWDKSLFPGMSLVVSLFLGCGRGGKGKGQAHMEAGCLGEFWYCNFFYPVLFIGSQGLAKYNMGAKGFSYLWHFKSSLCSAFFFPSWLQAQQDSHCYSLRSHHCNIIINVYILILKDAKTIHFLFIHCPFQMEVLEYFLLLKFFFSLSFLVSNLHRWHPLVYFFSCDPMAFMVWDK